MQKGLDGRDEKKLITSGYTARRTETTTDLIGKV